LDLLVVSIEAGLGLDQAIQHVARELYASHPQLSDEMSLVTLEMRHGKRRSEALRNFAERTGEAEFRKLVAILIQNDRFGTSMGESLRTHSDFLRVRRRQEAEERAVHAGGGGGTGSPTSIQVPLPHDENDRLTNKGA
jgi:tight adherence protein C